MCFKLGSYEMVLLEDDDNFKNWGLWERSLRHAFKRNIENPEPSFLILIISGYYAISSFLPSS